MAEDRQPRNPYPTVDVIVELEPGRVLLVQRRNPPPGWALPGGFVNYGESVETAAIREAREETGLQVTLTELLGVYSVPERDPRFHTMSTVFVGRAEGIPVAGDDAAATGLFGEAELPELAFDHARIVADYFEYRRTGRRPAPGSSGRER